jgi:Holliday junction resolvase-like predicted endonuclease
MKPGKTCSTWLKMRKFIMITKSWEEKMIEVDLICQRMKCQTKDGMEDH